MMKRENHALNISTNGVKLRQYRITGSGEYYYKQIGKLGTLHSKDHAEPVPNKPEFETSKESNSSHEQ